ncbi:MAG: MotA/TolQ/ExbB proton channel family protein [Acidobacteriota bacterium]|jgi:biopolymer transport protein ExbB
MDSLLAYLEAYPLVHDAVGIWISGGWAMIALAINAFLLFWIGINLWINLNRTKGLGRVSEAKWRTWIAEPEKRRGPIGKLIGFVMGATDLEDLAVRFRELHSTEIAPFARDLKFMRRAVSTAPLLGLLGTVTGMLSTFHALATGSGGDQTMDMIAGGISEALITTETGLVIALPGLFFQYHLARKRDRYEAFLAHLETVCTQYLYRLTRQREREVA